MCTLERASGEIDLPVAVPIRFCRAAGELATQVWKKARKPDAPAKQANGSRNQHGNAPGGTLHFRCS